MKSSGPRSTIERLRASTTVTSVERLAPICCEAEQTGSMSASPSVAKMARSVRITGNQIIGMRWPTRGIAVLAASLLFRIVCATVPAAAEHGAQTDGTVSQGTEYVGSEACRRCHESEYSSWRRTLHVQMTKPVAEARVEGAFGGDGQGRVQVEAY